MNCTGNCHQGRKTCETPLACEIAEQEKDNSVLSLSIALSGCILILAIIAGVALS
jgi:hypothetical protein